MLKIKLLVIGKTKFDYLIKAENDYLSRLKNFCFLEYTTIENNQKSKKLSQEEVKRKEKDLFFTHIENSEIVILLDERGKLFSSKEFSDWFTEKTLYSTKNISFLIGGAFGFHDDLRKRSDFSISMSKMTFSHQMIRCFFLEQLYRAQTIIHNLPYHHR